jgi:hypothetical protein
MNFVLLLACLVGTPVACAMLLMPDAPWSNTNRVGAVIFVACVGWAVGMGALARMRAEREGP